MTENTTQTDFDYLLHPQAFIEDDLGAFTWSGMRMIIDNVWKHRRVSVRACHGISKTFTGAAVAVTFLNMFPGSIVITTAPTNKLVEKLLWKEIGAIYQKHGDRLLGRQTQMSVKVGPQWFMFGFSTDRADRMEGHHAPFILWVIDEAKGVPPWLYESIEGSLTGGFARVLELSTTDGADQQSPFRKHHSEQRSQWKQIRLSAFDSPFVDIANFPDYVKEVNKKLYAYGKPETGYEWPIERANTVQLASEDWIRDRHNEWFETNKFMWETKVLGEFSTFGTNNIIPLKWVESAINAEVTPDGYIQPAIWGLDVARMGDDQSVLTEYRSKVVSLQQVWGKKNTMETTGIVRALIPNNEIVQVDAIGVGAGVFDRLAELGQPCYGIVSSEKAFEVEKYFNQRAEMWMTARDLFERQYKEGNVISIPDDPELIEDLTGMQYKIHSDGRLRAEAKDDFKKRLQRSPDKGDSFVYAIYVLPESRDQFFSEKDVENGVNI